MDELIRKMVADVHFTRPSRNMFLVARPDTPSEGPHVDAWDREMDARPRMSLDLYIQGTLLEWTN